MSSMKEMKSENADLTAKLEDSLKASENLEKIVDELRETILKTKEAQRSAEGLKKL
jgi:hypothetical protein